MAPRRSIHQDTDASIKKLVAMISGLKSSNHPPYAVLLGAGASIESGGMSWELLCRKVANDLHQEIPPTENDPIQYTIDKILHPRSDAIERTTVISKYLTGLNPSIGFRHLAQLIETGFIKQVFTTNWDPLIEKALSQMLPIDKYKVLVRGEVSDDIISQYLESNALQCTIVKMHGDLASRVLFMRQPESELSSNLRNTLCQIFAKGLIIVGSELQDIDIIAPILNTVHPGTIYYVNPVSPLPSSIAGLLLKNKGNVSITGEQGKHDAFFSRLNIGVQTHVCNEVIDKKRTVEAAILEKQERGRGYINYSSITQMVERFSKQILALKPDLVFFIDDPAAPGGMELKKRMESHLGKVATATIGISGERGNRVLHRRVRTKQSISPQKQAPIIVILDAITFSGNTLTLAKNKVQEWYEYAVVKTGVLLVSQHLKDKLDAKHPLKDLIFLEQTDRQIRDFFPMGCYPNDR